MCVCAYVYIYIYIHTHTDTHIHIYIYIHTHSLKTYHKSMIGLGIARSLRLGPSSGCLETTSIYQPIPNYDFQELPLAAAKLLQHVVTSTGLPGLPVQYPVDGQQVAAAP